MKFTQRIIGGLPGPLFPTSFISPTSPLDGLLAGFWPAMVPESIIGVKKKTPNQPKGQLSTQILVRDPTLLSEKMSGPNEM
jgi:hypothetical protein